ncbi:DUF721 domain-containing protein [Streptomyces sp. NPDC004267]|uniref:DUF721 domain-containing protein n=1 Tax=Streptomyces sp. NPDC004267 TaxID=3364694 RepID=UPI0036A2BBA5
MSGGETSVVDPARVALRAAMEAARKDGSGQKAKQRQRPVRTVRRDGREPMGLGAAIGALVTERAWELPAAGATLRERWEAIAPELAGHVDSGRLTVRRESSAWATKARLEQTRVIAAANKAAGRTVVNSLRILPPGAASVSAPAADVALAEPAPVAPTGPVKTRETTSASYRRALAGRRCSQGGDRVTTELSGVEFTQWSLPMPERGRRTTAGPGEAEAELSRGVAGGLARRWPRTGLLNRTCEAARRPSDWKLDFELLDLPARADQGHNLLVIPYAGLSGTTYEVLQFVEREVLPAASRPQGVRHGDHDSGLRFPGKGGAAMSMGAERIGARFGRLL